MRRYSCAGVRLIARIRSSPAMATGSRSPSSRVRATVDTATHGRRSSGVASRAASFTTPTGTPPLVTVTMPPASAACARRTASPSGRSSGTVRVRRARSRATRPGRRRAQPGRRHRVRRARSTGTARSRTPARSRGCVGCDVGELVHQQRPAQHRDGGDPAAPARDERAAVGVAGDAPHAGLEHPPAVERQAGDQVEARRPAGWRRRGPPPPARAARRG